MQINRFLVFICATLFMGTVIASAQTIEESDSTHFRPIPLSPEKSAQASVDRMDSLLNLSEQQQQKLYKLFLKWAREDSQTTMGGRPGFGGGMPQQGGMGGGMGMPPRGGMGGGMGMPPQGNLPEGFGQGQMPPNISSEDIAAQREQMEKKMEKREKKIKKILTEEQYNLWQEESNRPGILDTKVLRLGPLQGPPNMENQE